MIDKLIQEQIEYYCQRAPEYDEWFYRIGRYDRGAKNNQRWFDEIKIVQKKLQEFAPQNEILELACGTGIWTQELLKIGDKITAIDISPESILLNKKKLKSPKVKYKKLDLFEWEPEAEYDFVFLAFWLSHVPPQKLDDFLEKVGRSVKSGGRIFIVDSQFHATSTARNHQIKDDGKIYQSRKLNDGRTFQVIKVYNSAEYLASKLKKFGFEMEANTTERYFVYPLGTKI